MSLLLTVQAEEMVVTLQRYLHSIQVPPEMVQVRICNSFLAAVLIWSTLRVSVRSAIISEKIPCFPVIFVVGLFSVSQV